MRSKKYITGIIHSSQVGQRLDQGLAILFSQYSRSEIKKWILNGVVTVNGVVKKTPKEKLFGGEHIIIELIIENNSQLECNNILLNIIYEDNEIIIINKQRGLVVHPGAGHSNNTILNVLLSRYPSSINLPRAGIVHRLDKDTTGLMILAKTITAQYNLIKAIKERKIIREYAAIINGSLITGGHVNLPIARHPTKRTKMTINTMGKSAITHYRIITRFRFHTFISLKLETGRTHQIRVHMSHINHPLVGDPLYNHCKYMPKGISKSCRTMLYDFDRPALHAILLRLVHPISLKEMTFHAPLPYDMEKILEVLRMDDNLKCQRYSN